MKNTVLLVDANPMEAEALEQALRRGAYELTRVLHPREARNFMEESVDLVICDLRSGRDAAFELLRDWSERMETPPFVFLIDAGDVQSAVDGMKLGAADCLIKPIDPRKLHDLAMQILGSGSNGRTHAAVHSHSNDPTSNSGNGSHGLEIPEGTSLEDLERAAVRQALEQHRGNRTHAARELGISVRTLQRKLKAWRLPILTLHHYPAGTSGMTISSD